jgi:hypothetical protein
MLRAAEMARVSSGVTAVSSLDGDFVSVLGGGGGGEAGCVGADHGDDDDELPALDCAAPPPAAP